MEVCFREALLAMGVIFNNEVDGSVFLWCGYSPLTPVRIFSLVLYYVSLWFFKELQCGFILLGLGSSSGKALFWVKGRGQWSIDVNWCNNLKGLCLWGALRYKVLDVMKLERVLFVNFSSSRSG